MESQEALREEKERCKRLADRDQQMEERREVFEGSSGIATKLILDQDEETKTPLVQVHRNLVTHLKPHQVDGESGRPSSLLTTHLRFSVAETHRDPPPLTQGSGSCGTAAASR